VLSAVLIALLMLPASFVWAQKTASPTQKALPVPGQVKFTQKISAEAGGLSPNLLEIIDLFGSSAASLGDLDGDDVTDIAVGARGDDDGSSDAGAVYVLFLNSNGTVGSSVKISRSQGNFTGYLEAFDRFGTSIASIGDLNGDDVTDIAVGALGDDDGQGLAGAVYVLFLKEEGKVRFFQKISSTQGGLRASPDSADGFGMSVARVGDLGGDGVGELAVGAAGDDDGGSAAGATYVLFLDRLGRSRYFQKISNSQGQ
jgi:hypothetical protein